MTSRTRKQQKAVIWQSLLIRSQAGNRKDYHQFLREVTPYIKGILSQTLPNTQSVHDVSQEVLLSIHRALPSYDPDRPVLPWINAIIRYRQLDFLRKWMKTQKAEIYDNELFDVICETFPTPIANKDLAIDDELDKAISKLPKKQQLSLRLLKIEGLTVKEASAKTGMSESAIKVSAHRAYKTLRKNLDPKWRSS